jgi:DNA-directed RNA polymerase subunit RPC12/RpoP
VGNETQVYLCTGCGQLLFSDDGCTIETSENPSRCANCDSPMDLADSKSFIEARIKTEDVERILFAFGTVGKG